MLRTPTVVLAALALMAPLAPVAHAVQPIRASGRTSAAQETPVRGWTVGLDRRVLTKNGQYVASGRGFETVGVRWATRRTPVVEVRTRTDGRWSGWEELDPIRDFGESGGTPPRSTEPQWFGPAEAARVRVTAGFGKGMKLVLVDPGYSPSDEPAATEASASERTAAMTTARSKKPRWAPIPKILRRNDWSANERWAEDDRYFTSMIKQAHIHHTASSNTYSRADVPGIIRSMYWYHTKQLGWSDIGYNFLVDKFGRIWQGRGGKVKKSVRGAHTLGFNHASFGVAAIGNFETARVRRPMVRAIARLTAWKLDMHGRRPAGRTKVWSYGSDRYAKGQWVRLRVIDGHRDTNYTACPGDNLYDKLPRIRKRAQTRADNYN